MDAVERAILAPQIKIIVQGRRFTVRLLPPGLAGGICSSISAHSASVRSLG